MHLFIAGPPKVVDVLRTLPVQHESISDPALLPTTWDDKHPEVVSKITFYTGKLHDLLVQSAPPVWPVILLDRTDASFTSQLDQVTYLEDYPYVVDISSREDGYAIRRSLTERVLDNIRTIQNAMLHAHAQAHLEKALTTVLKFTPFPKAWMNWFPDWTSVMSKQPIVSFDRSARNSIPRDYRARVEDVVVTQLYTPNRRPLVSPEALEKFQERTNGLLGIPAKPE